MKKRKWIKRYLITYGAISLGYFILKFLLAFLGIEFRAGVTILVSIVMIGGAFLFLGLFMGSGLRRYKERNPNARVISVLYEILLVVFGVGASVILLIMELFVIAANPTEEYIGEGFLRVNTGYRDADYKYYKRFLFLARIETLPDENRELSELVEELESRNQVSDLAVPEPGTGDEAGNEETETEESAQESENAQKETENTKEIEKNTVQQEGEVQEETPQSKIEVKKAGDPPYDTPEKAFRKIYEAVLSKTYRQAWEAYNAKGNFYGLLEEGETQYKEYGTVEYEDTLVYERKSDDGQAQMFVKYRTYYKTSGLERNQIAQDIKERFCVDMESGEVWTEDVPWA